MVRNKPQANRRILLNATKTSENRARSNALALKRDYGNSINDLNNTDDDPGNYLRLCSELDGEIATSKGSQKKRKRRKISRALKEIRVYQKTTNLLVPRSPFLRLFKEIVNNSCARNHGLNVSVDAVAALQEATESFMVQMFEYSNLNAIHGKRITVFPKDIALWRRYVGI